MKKWFKNPIVIGLIVVSVSWFAWMTRVGILNEGKAENTAVQVADTQIKAHIANLKTQIDTLCTGMGDLKTSLENHEKIQTVQIEKIYSLLITMARENRASAKSLSEKVPGK
jgi:Na+-translocating ferredoxin:NAD+ oxidoreductase RnfD subunit